MATLVYSLCALTSLACAVLLLRGYFASRVRLLLWSGLCFAGLAANNVLLLIDKRVVPTLDLSLWRSLPALAGVALLLYGLVWETR
ncbi:MAG TPA: DUF5985 family protein [Longimicrobium sp.]